MAEMTEMTQTNNSATSLPSYHSNQDVPPTYSENLTEPQQAYIAHQRYAFENIDAKPPPITPNNARPADIEARHQPARPDADAVIRRDKLIRWAGCTGLILFLVLFAMGCVGIPVLRDLVAKGNPSIPPPYPEDVWYDCDRRLNTSQSMWFWIIYAVWGGFAVVDLVLIHRSVAHQRGRRMACEATIICLTMLTIPAWLLVWSLKGNCPKEFVEGVL